MKISEIIRKLKEIQAKEGDLDVKYSGEAGDEETLYFVDVEESFDADGKKRRYVLLS